MIKIGICDVDKLYLKKIKEEVEICFANYNLKVSIDTFTQGINLLREYFNNNYDLVILDISMLGQNKSGLEIGQYIYQGIEKHNLIYLIHDINLVFQAMKVRPYRVICKSNIEVELKEVLIEWIIEFCTTKPLIVKTYMGKISVPRYSIRYIEVRGHNVSIHIEKMIIETRKSISDLENELSNEFFIRPHCSYLCSLKYISSFKNDIISLDNGEIIPVSRSKQKLCMCAYLRYKEKYSL